MPVPHDGSPAEGTAHCRTPFAHSTRHTIRHGRRSPLHWQGWCTSLCQTSGTRGQPGLVFRFTHLLLPGQNLGEGWWAPAVMCADTQRNEISLRRHTKTRNITGKLQRGLCLKATPLSLEFSARCIFYLEGLHSPCNPNHMYQHY